MISWVKATAAVTFTALAIALVAWALWHAHVALTLTVLALLVAVALERPVHWLEVHLRSRGAAIALVALGVVAAIAAVALLFVPPAVAQVRELTQSGPALLQRVEGSEPFRVAARNVDLNALLDRLRERAPTVATAVVGQAVAVVTLLGRGVAALVTVLFIVVFMLASGRQLVWAAMAKVRPERRPLYAEVLAELYRSLGGYIGGLFLLVLSNAFFSGTFLAVSGVGYFLPLAVFAGLSSLIPYAGSIAAGAALSLVAWATGGPWLAVATIAYFVLYQQLESHVIAPLVYRRAVDLNPLVILLVVLFMTELAGIPGAVIAVPLAATVQIVARAAFRLRRERLRLPDVVPGPELLDPRAAPPAGEPRRA